MFTYDLEVIISFKIQPTG